MNPSGRIIKNLKQLSGLMVVALASTLLVSAPGSAETWTTKGTCWFNGVPRGCRVQAASDLSAQAWSATYVIDWADGIRQTIDVGSDIRASVLVDGKRTAAEQQPTDRYGHCVIRTVTGNVTIFDSGRARLGGDVAPC